MSLFSLKKHSLSLSLSLQLFLFLSSIRFGCRFVFFSSLLHFFSSGEIKALVFSLFFPCFRGDRKPHPFVSLSLSYEERVLENPISLSNTPQHTQRERSSSLRKKRSTPPINSRAKAGKKKMDWISSHCGTRTQQPQSRRVKDENAYISENKSVRACVTFRPPPRGMPPKFILSLLL